MPVPKVGAKAPVFTAVASSGPVKLSHFKGKYVVLYFYPKDNTPGCTQEACDFRDALASLAGDDVVVLGVSPQGVASHDKFAAKYELPFQLLADEDHALAELYGVWVEKQQYGRTYLGIQRATFLIDPQGKLAHVWPKVTVKGHVAAVMAEIAAARTQ